MEQERAANKFDEAQKSYGMCGADASSQREDADKSNRAEERHKTTQQNKQTEDSCDLKTEEEKPQEDLIHMPTTGGAEAPGCTPCDLTHEPAGG